MGKGYNNYMCKKPFHPGSKANIKRAWMAEQKTENDKRKQEELKVQYEKEQDLYNNRTLLGTENKEKLELNFMYEAPPGAKRERQKEDDEPEYKFEWQRKYNAPREDYAKGNTDIKDQPFGIPVRNVRCIKCHKWGHINTDKECPLFSQASTSSMPTTSMDPIELMRQMREDGYNLKETVLGHKLNSYAANQQLIPSDESDPEADFLKSLSTADKKKLLRKLKKLSKKAAKKKKKSKKSKKTKKKDYSDSDTAKEKKSESSSDSDSSLSDDDHHTKKKHMKKHNKHSPTNAKEKSTYKDVTMNTKSDNKLSHEQLQKELRRENDYLKLSKHRTDPTIKNEYNLHNEKYNNSHKEISKHKSKDYGTGDVNKVIKHEKRKSSDRSVSPEARALKKFKKSSTSRVIKSEKISEEQFKFEKHKRCQYSTSPESPEFKTSSRSNINEPAYKSDKYSQKYKHRKHDRSISPKTKTLKSNFIQIGGQVDRPSWLDRSKRHDYSSSSESKSSKISKKSSSIEGTDKRDKFSQKEKSKNHQKIHIQNATPEFRTLSKSGEESKKLSEKDKLKNHDYNATLESRKSTKSGNKSEKKFEKDKNNYHSTTPESEKSTKLEDKSKKISEKDENYDHSATLESKVPSKSDSKREKPLEKEEHENISNSVIPDSKTSSNSKLAESVKPSEKSKSSDTFQLPKLSTNSVSIKGEGKNVDVASQNKSKNPNQKVSFETEIHNSANKSGSGELTDSETSCHKDDGDKKSTSKKSEQSSAFTKIDATKDSEFEKRCQRVEKLKHPDGFRHGYPQAVIDSNYLPATKEYSGIEDDRFRDVHRDRRSPSIKQKYKS